MAYVVIVFFVLIIFVLSFLLWRCHRIVDALPTGEKDLSLDDVEIAVMRTLDKGPIVAFAAVKIRGAVLLKDMRILADDNGDLRIEVPARVTKKGHLMDVYQFIDSRFKQELFDAILDKYKHL